MNRAIKQPGENLIFAYDFAAELAGNAIASILSVACIARGGGAVLTIHSQGFDASTVRVSWQGGVDGETYLTTVAIEDSAGQRIEMEAEIVCLDLDWSMPDGGAGYLSIARFVEKVGLDEAVRLTDVNGVGRIDRATMVAALADAQSLVDAHIAARYTVPLATVPALVEVWVGDLARARLYTRDMPEGVKRAADSAQRMLERVAAGQLPLAGVAPDAATAASSSPVMIAPGKRAYPDGLGDY